MTLTDYYIRLIEWLRKHKDLTEAEIEDYRKRLREEMGV